ncbi:MAG: RIP metalloprotease RseP, partial [Cyclobacteriaceae bacterium]
AWQRLIVMLGGIIVNVITGILIFIGLTYFMGDTYIPKNLVNENGGVEARELAKQIGFETGDKVVKINGQDFTDFQDVAKPDVLLSQDSYYTVLRDGQEVRIEIPSDFIENFNSKDAINKFLMPRIPATVGYVSENSIAEKVGLKVDDQMIEVDGQPAYYFDEVNRIVQSGARDSISFKVKRGSEILSFKESFKGQEIIGFASKGLDKDQLAYINYGFGESIGLGTERAFGVIFLQLKAFKKIFSGDISFQKSLSGPIGMAQAFGTVWDWERFWRMTGLLSMVLAFMNLLPIPALDGGYVVFLLYEMISGREPSEKFFETSLKIGMAILLLLMVFVFYNDIAKIFTGG